jgi:hypothetical protein
MELLWAGMESHLLEITAQGGIPTTQGITATAQV